MVHGLETSKARSSEDSTTPREEALAHTALPWQTEEHPNPGFGLDITTSDTTICQHIENPADAAFIVRACNSHYQLLSALEGLVGLVRLGQSAHIPAGHWTEHMAFKAADLALFRAKYEEGL